MIYVRLTYICGSHSNDHIVGVLIVRGVLYHLIRLIHRGQLGVAQAIQHRFDQSLELLGVLIENGLLLIVGPRVVEYLLDIAPEIVHARIWVHIRLALQIPSCRRHITPLHLLVTSLHLWRLMRF